MIKEKKWQYLNKRKAAWPHVLAEAQIQNLAHQHAVSALSAAKWNFLIACAQIAALTTAKKF